MSRAVPPAARARDAVALALLAAGAGTYLFAWRGMQALAERRVVAAPGTYLMTQWNDYRLLSKAGIAGMAAGLAVGAWAFLRNRQPAAAAADVPVAPTPPQAPLTP